MRKGESGTVLVVSLLMLAMVSLMGTIAVKTAQTEIMISRNYYYKMKSFYNAEAGVNVALADMNNLTDEFDNPDWKVNMKHGDYDLDLPFEFNVYHKVGITGDVIKVGDYPIEEIYGVGIGPTNAQTVIKAEVFKDIVLLDINAPLYAALNLTTNGTSTSAQGEYNLYCDPPYDRRLWDVITTGDAAMGFTAEEYPDANTGLWDERMKDKAKYPVADVFNKLKKRAKTVIASNNIELGSEENPTGIYLLVEDDGGDVKVNNISGYGILLVEGPVEMELGGNIDWHGIILSTGDARFNGGGSKEIYGAFLGGGNVTIDGSVDFLWDCEVMAKIMESVNRYRMISWQEM